MFHLASFNINNVIFNEIDRKKQVARNITYVNNQDIIRFLYKEAAILAAFLNVNKVKLNGMDREKTSSSQYLG
jgi:hypothetical protein